jgi:FAD/FMN-containing dehydrogenase
VKVNLKGELTKILGAEYFSDDQETLKQYSKDYSLVPPRMPTCVVKPKNVEEIQKIVKLANKLKTPIVPSSSGAHFYGASIPSQGGIVVDLVRMTRILQIDERNRKVMIEPRVTWGQLQEELEKHDLMALNPLLPHASKSVLTSHLEREPIIIPKFEYSEPVLTMEAVLPTGELFRTGSASTPDALSPKAHTDLCMPYGPGTNFFRLFHGAQGTLGIVTWMNVKVEYLPKTQKIFFIQFSEINDAVEPLYRIQRLMLGNECLLVNDFNLANILTEEWPGNFEESRKTLPPFTLILVLAGGRRLPEEKIEYERAQTTRRENRV